MKITREDFLQKLIRIFLASVLGLIAIALGNRMVSGNECSQCPGKGICIGDTDCSRFLAETK